MIAIVCSTVADGVPILKISGRDRMGKDTGLALDEAEVAARIYPQENHQAAVEGILGR